MTCWSLCDNGLTKKNYSSSGVLTRNYRMDYVHTAIWCCIAQDSLVIMHYSTTRGTLDCKRISTCCMWLDVYHNFFMTWSYADANSAIQKWILSIIVNPPLGNIPSCFWLEVRDQFVNVPSQWETTLHCHAASHLCALTKWSLGGSPLIREVMVPSLNLMPFWKMNLTKITIFMFLTKTSSNVTEK